MRILSVTSLLLSAAAQLTQAAGPRVDIVIGDKAPALEKRAAEDIAADLKKVYDAEVKIATAAPEGAENVIFVGSPETNDQTAKQIDENWPNLSKHSHFLRTNKYRGKPALFVGGGSPVAAYWAAAEFAHEIGIRSMLYGDLYPVNPRPFGLEGFDVVMHHRDGDYIRTDLDPFPTGYTSWGLGDQKRLLRQLARLKYRNIELGTYSWQPFVHFEIDGVKKQTGVLWFGWEFPVSGDTAGRSAFKGAKLFENPEFAGKLTYEERLTAGRKLMGGIIDEAHSLGMAVAINTSLMEFPKEFSPLLPGSKPTLESGSLAVRSLEKRGADDKRTPHEKIHFEAYKATYERINSFELMDGTKIDSRQFAPLVVDSNFSAYRSSRSRFGPALTDKDTSLSLIPPICGEGVDGSVLKANQQILDASGLIKKNDMLFNMPAPEMVLKHYASSDPPPEWWSKVRDNYLGAMNDMYRANSRAREGGRSYTLYLARRCEFGYEYMNCVEATRLAGIARSKKDTVEQRAQLEKAIESMNSACSALAAVARDQSDRGMIAVCNEFGYKALQKELEKLDAE